MSYIQQKSSSQREVHGNTGLPQKKQEKSQINNLPYNLKELEKEEQTKSKSAEGNNKDKRGNK